MCCPPRRWGEQQPTKQTKQTPKKQTSRCCLHGAGCWSLPAGGVRWANLPSLSQGGGAGSGQVFWGERETSRRLFALRSLPLHGGTQQVCLLPLPTCCEAADFNRCLALCTRTGARGGCAASRVWCKARRVRLPFPASLRSLGVVPGTGSVAFACGINKICRWLGWTLQFGAREGPFVQGGGRRGGQTGHVPPLPVQHPQLTALLPAVLLFVPHFCG